MLSFLNVTKTYARFDDNLGGDPLSDVIEEGIGHFSYEHMRIPGGGGLVNA